MHSLGIVDISSSNDKSILIGQYTMLADQAHKINEVRELANSWWISINAGLLGIVAFFKNITGLSCEEKHVLLYSLSCIGIMVCLLWASSLHTMGKSLNIKVRMLVDLEQHLPAKIYTYSSKNRNMHRSMIYVFIKESIIPGIIIIGYLGFILLISCRPNIADSIAS